MQPRNNFDLSHYIAQVGEVGRLQTLSVIPVLANDSMACQMEMSVNLSPLNRPLKIDSKCDIYSFYVKHRYIYGDSWVDMLQAGINGVAGTDYTAFATVGNGTANGNELGYLPVNGATIPLFYVDGYASIWKEFFRIPTVNEETDADIPQPGVLLTNVQGKYGFPVSRLESAMTGGSLTAVDEENRMAESTSGTSGDAVDALDIKKAQNLYKSETDRHYFATRYRDLIKKAFGSSGVSIDVDERPELLAHTSQWISGYDVDAQDFSNLGKAIGKSSAMIVHKMGKKYFNEHGAVWHMAVIRFPTIATDETHYYTNNTMDYANAAGDPLTWEAEEPMPYTLGDFHMNQAASGNLGYQAYGQWLRYHPNAINRIYHQRAGYPFLSWNAVAAMDAEKAAYCHGMDVAVTPFNIEYSDYFGNDDLGHWQIYAICKTDVDRIIPNAIKSIYAGV